MKRKQTPLPYSIYYWQVVGYAFLGFLASFYLTYTHYKNHTDITFSSFCAITQAVNCDTVAQSPFSIYLGLPIAIWGIFAYSLFLVLLTPLRQSEKKYSPTWSFIIVLALLASCCSVYLALLSATRIHSWCIVCAVTYAVNFLLAFSSWIIFRRFSATDFFASIPTAFKILANSTPVKWGITLLIISVVVTQISLPAYWRQKADVLNTSVASGITKEGHPWIGAETPLLVIEEFTDYQCFQCSKVHFYLRRLLNQHPDHIRLVHRHYPLDHEFNKIVAPDPIHVGSGRLALIAVVAAEHGAFWPVNDALYQATHSKKEFIDLALFAELIGISTEKLATEMFTAKTLKHLQQDILDGLRHKIIGTPSFVVNGSVYEKTLPPELLKDIIK